MTTEPTTAPGPEGEAVERVRAAVKALRPLVLGRDFLFVEDRPSQDRWQLRLSDLDALLAAVDRLTAALRGAKTHVGALILERDDARDLAFRAAFSPEEGAEVEWAIRHPHGSMQPGSEEACRWYAARDGETGTVVRRTVGPWRPAPSPSSGEDGGDGR